MAQHIVYLGKHSILLERNMYAAFVSCSVLYMLLRSSSLIVQIFLSLLIFFSYGCSISYPESCVQVSVIINFLLSVLPVFNFYSLGMFFNLHKIIFFSNLHSTAFPPLPSPVRLNWWNLELRKEYTRVGISDCQMPAYLSR